MINRFHLKIQAFRENSQNSTGWVGKIYSTSRTFSRNQYQDERNKGLSQKFKQLVKLMKTLNNYSDLEAL